MQSALIYAKTDFEVLQLQAVGDIAVHLICRHDLAEGSILVPAKSTVIRGRPQPFRKLQQ